MERENTDDDSLQARTIRLVAELERMLSPVKVADLLMLDDCSDMSPPGSLFEIGKLIMISRGAHAILSASVEPRDKLVAIQHLIKHHVSGEYWSPDGATRKSWLHRRNERTIRKGRGMVITPMRSSVVAGSQIRVVTLLGEMTTAILTLGEIRKIVGEGVDPGEN